MAATVFQTLKNALPTSTRKVLFDLKLRVGGFLGRDSQGFEPYEIEREAFGERLKLYIGNAEGREWYDEVALGEELWEEVRFLKEKMLAEGDVVLDCGAHHGVLTVLFAKWIGEKGKVTAFDPVPDNVRFARENIKRNGLKNAEVVRAAVGSHHGEIHFSKGSNASVGFGSLKENVAELLCLDDYAELQPTFLKIDVEGCETEVLKGAAKVLAKRPKIMMEVHGNLLDLFDTSAEEVMSFLPQDDYELWIQWSEWEAPEPYDPSMKIGKNRVHIFALPKEKETPPAKAVAEN